jgi:hypothetical protein
MAMTEGFFFQNVIITLLIVLTLFVLILAFLYMVYGRRETTATTGGSEPKTPKPKGT